MKSSYLGLNGSGSYGTLGEIRVMDRGTNQTIIGSINSGTSYSLMNIDGNALVLGGDTNFAHPVAYALLASTTAAGIYNTIAGNYGLYITDAAFTYVGGGNASASLVFNWSTVTSPLIQSGTSGTQLTIGTNKSGAVLVLES